jgi:putative DNA primase/helicase
MTPIRSSTGSAVRLLPHTTTLGIAEGIETALSAYQLFNVPTWAALDANSLKSVVLPGGLKELYIFGDNDSNYVGQEATYALARRASLAGLVVTTYTPTEVDTDWNDFLLNQPQSSGGQL